MSNIQANYVLVLKEDCPTCALVEPIVADIANAGLSLRVWSQDNPKFPSTVATVEDDRTLEQSYFLNIETVPTLIKYLNGSEVERTVGWDAAEWRRLTALDSLGDTLPAFRPGCGSMSVYPGIAEKLELQFNAPNFQARRLEIFDEEDPIEACYDRGWSDGFPVVPPTELRVMKMLAGTSRAPEEIIGSVPPDLQACTVEKVAINAVMAGCKPEYMPVVIAALEAALTDAFCMHGLLATTWFSGPMIIVNGPISRAIGMNSGGNALGQGNRANATIGRALQLIIRNVGGGRPGGVDRSTLGNPGKYSFCFSEDEQNSCWESLSQERGFGPDVSTVTLFAADGVQGVVDQKSRDPDSLCSSFALSLLAVGHHKLAMLSDVFLVISPEHERVFREANWTKAQVKECLIQKTLRPGKELVAGVAGIAEGMPDYVADMTLSKIRPDGLNIVRAGGTAGLFSAIIGGWLASGDMGSAPVTREIKL